MSVTDYYLALPPTEFATDSEGNQVKNKAALTKLRRSMIKTEDKKNGFLRLEGMWEGWGEIALFKQTNGNYLVGIVQTGCGPACGGSLKFLSYSKGKWSDVTAKVFAEPTEAVVEKAFQQKKINTEEDGLTFFYRLPQVGTTVKMQCNTCEPSDSTNSDGEDVTLLEFVWNGEKFSLKK